MKSTAALEQRPQRKGQKFVNPWPDFQSHGFRDLLRWAVERRRRNPSSAPFAYTLSRTAPSYAVPRAHPGALTATWIGHTTTLLQLGGMNILTDPVWSERASPLSFAGPRRLTPPGVAFDDLPIIDAIVISHNHYDHLDASTVDRLISRFPAAAWRVPSGVGAFVRARGARDVVECGWYDSSAIGALGIVCVPAQHFSGRGLFDRDKTLWCGWVLRSECHSIYFAGDTAFNPSFEEIAARYGPFDLALMPIGAYDPRWFMRSVHMDPEECVSAWQLVASGPRQPVLLATHWGTFRLTDEPLSEPPERMLRAWASASLPSDRLWIAQLGETRTL